MQTTVNSKALASALSRIAPFIPAKASLPIVECVLIEVTGDTMRLTGTNCDMQATVTIECDTKKDGSLCIAMRKIQGFMDGAEGNILFKLKDDMATLTRKDGKRKADYACLDAAEFPKMAEEDMGEPNLCENFIRAISRIHNFASTEESRRVLCSIVCDVDTLVCSDGRAIAAHPFAIEKQAVIPIDFARGLIKTKSEAVSVSLTEKLIQVDCGDSVFTSKLIESPVPMNWRQCSAETPSTVIFNREEMLSVVNQGSKASDTVCQIDFGNDKVMVHSGSGKDFESDESGAPNVFSGSFRGKPSYIKAALQGNTDESVVTLGLSEAGTQMQVTAGDVKYIIMGMRQTK